MLWQINTEFVILHDDIIEYRNYAYCTLSFIFNIFIIYF